MRRKGVTLNRGMLQVRQDPRHFLCCLGCPLRGAPHDCRYRRSLDTADFKDMQILNVATQCLPPRALSMPRSSGLLYQLEAGDAHMVRMVVCVPLVDPCF